MQQSLLSYLTFGFCHFRALGVSGGAKATPKPPDEFVIPQKTPDTSLTMHHFWVQSSPFALRNNFSEKNH